MPELPSHREQLLLRSFETDPRPSSLCVLVVVGGVLPVLPVRGLELVWDDHASHMQL